MFDSHCLNKKQINLNNDRRAAKQRVSATVCVSLLQNLHPRWLKYFIQY